jgi:hypothetical protein
MIFLAAIGLVMLGRARPNPRAISTLRERAIEAQRIADHAARVARDLAAQWSAEQSRAGDRRA